MSTISVQPASDSDREAFLVMWKDFVSLAPGEPGNYTMGELNWQRIRDPAHTLQCIICVDADGKQIGFTLFSPLPFTWSRGEVCYLQDIYVCAENRGMGAAQKMIAHLRELGEAAGWFKIFWMTQPDNVAAQRVYDKVAEQMDYLRYDLNISPP